MILAERGFWFWLRCLLILRPEWLVNIHQRVARFARVEKVSCCRGASCILDWVWRRGLWCLNEDCFVSARVAESGRWLWYRCFEAGQCGNGLIKIWCANALSTVCALVAFLEERRPGEDGGSSICIEVFSGLVVCASRYGRRVNQCCWFVS